MKINWPILLVTALILAALILFLVIRNRRDKKEFEHQLNEDYPKPKEDEHTTDADDLKST